MVADRVVSIPGAMQAVAAYLRKFIDTVTLSKKPCESSKAKKRKGSRSLDSGLGSYTEDGEDGSSRHEEDVFEELPFRPWNNDIDDRQRGEHLKIPASRLRPDGALCVQDETAEGVVVTVPTCRKVNILSFVPSQDEPSRKGSWLSDGLNYYDGEELRFADSFEEEEHAIPSENTQQSLDGDVTQADDIGSHGRKCPALSCPPCLPGEVSLEPDRRSPPVDQSIFLTPPSSPVDLTFTSLLSEADHCDPVVSSSLYSADHDMTRISPDTPQEHTGAHVSGSSSDTPHEHTGTHVSGSSSDTPHEHTGTHVSGSSSDTPHEHTGTHVSGSSPDTPHEHTGTHVSGSSSDTPHEHTGTHVSGSPLSFVGNDQEFKDAEKLQTDLGDKKTSVMSSSEPLLTCHRCTDQTTSRQEKKGEYSREEETVKSKAKDVPTQPSDINCTPEQSIPYHDICPTEFLSVHSLDVSTRSRVKNSPDTFPPDETRQSPHPEPVDNVHSPCQNDTGQSSPTTLEELKYSKINFLSKDHYSQHEKQTQLQTTDLLYPEIIGECVSTHSTYQNPHVDENDFDSCSSRDNASRETTTFDGTTSTASSSLVVLSYNSVEGRSSGTESAKGESHKSLSSVIGESHKSLSSVIGKSHKSLSSIIGESQKSLAKVSDGSRAPLASINREISPHNDGNQKAQGCFRTDTVTPLGPTSPDVTTDSATTIGLTSADVTTDSATTIGLTSPDVCNESSGKRESTFSSANEEIQSIPPPYENSGHPESVSSIPTSVSYDSQLTLASIEDSLTESAERTESPSVEHFYTLAVPDTLEDDSSDEQESIGVLNSEHETTRAANTEQEHTHVSNTEQEPPCVSNTEQQPPCVSNTEQEPHAVSNTEEEPTGVSNTEQEPTGVSTTEQEPTDVSNTEQEPPRISNTEKEPPRVSNAEQEHTHVSNTEQEPTCVSNTEQEPPRISNAEQEHTHVSNTEQEPTCVSNKEQEPPAVSNTEEEPTGVSNTEREPPRVSNTEEVPAGVSNTEQEPTGVSKKEQEPPAVSNTEQEFTGVSSTEHEPTGVSNTEEEPTGVSNIEQEPTGVSNTEQEPTGVSNRSCPGGDVSLSLCSAEDVPPHTVLGTTALTPVHRKHKCHETDIEEDRSRVNGKIGELDALRDTVDIFMNDNPGSVLTPGCEGTGESRSTGLSDYDFSDGEDTMEITCLVESEQDEEDGGEDSDSDSDSSCSDCGCNNNSSSSEDSSDEEFINIIRNSKFRILPVIYEADEHSQVTDEDEGDEDVGEEEAIFYDALDQGTTSRGSRADRFKDYLISTSRHTRASLPPEHSDDVEHGDLCEVVARDTSSGQTLSEADSGQSALTNREYDSEHRVQGTVLSVGKTDQHEFRCVLSLLSKVWMPRKLCRHLALGTLKEILKVRCARLGLCPGAPLTPQAGHILVVSAFSGLLDVLDKVGALSL